MAEAKALVKGPTPRRLKKYVAKCLRLKSYLRSPGDGRTEGRIPAATLLWALLMGALLRRAAFAGIEALVRSRARRALIDDAVAVGRDRGHVRYRSGVHRVPQDLVDGRPVDGSAHA